MYCTQTDMETRFSEQELMQLTDKDGSAGAVVTAVLDQAIRDASATIDGYIGGRCQLPLSSVPAILTRTACDLARYYLYDDQLGDEHQVTKRYQSAIKYLEQVGSGKVDLGISAGGERPKPTSTAVMHSGGSVFGRDRSKGFI
ncbi:gp436 family protein [Vibrio alginolyticus]|uniref:gp436 family protein n=1 Tax=Vibrio alginolyticus TaxID=663 RepID=UPI004068DECA